jgi:LPS-assembly protein
VNTLTYDQIFNYNRFTGIDRIGDANQLGWGVTTRLIDQESGFEKIRLGIGNIIYFAERRVTLCNDDSCSDNPGNPTNSYSLSPLSGVFNYHINPAWSFNANAIYNPITREMDNTTVGFQYRPDDLRLINLGYTYARKGDVLSGVQTTESIDNLKVTDVSVAWPIKENFSVVGRWSQNWNREHLQNLVYGLQYDTCCWAARMVGGQAFTGFDPNNNNRPKYNSEFYIQFSLKGLGDAGTGNPGGLLSGIPGYKTQFGQEIK